MTLKALAEELHTSPMTIYRRLAKQGHNISEYRGEGGEITSEGCSIIGALFTSITPSNTTITEGTTSSTTPAAHEAHTEHNDVEVARMETTVAGLEAERAGLLRLVETLEAEVADLRSRLDAAEAERRQRDQLLLTGGIGGGFRGWWRRFRGGGGTN